MTVRIALLLSAILLAAVIAPVTESPAQASAVEPTVRLMTYNLNWGNPDHGATLDAIAAGDADVVLLQEVTDEWRRVLRARFARQYAHQAYRLHGRAAGGIAVLSKHAITAEELWAPPPGAFFPAQRVVIDAPFGPLQILNVHLRPCIDGGSWVRGFLTTPPVRRREIETHWKKMDYQLPTVVAGDFNEDDTGRAIHYLQHHGMTRVPTDGPQTWHYETVLDGKRTDLLKMDIDHVMIDSHFLASDAKVLDAGTSDHRPVVVTLRRK
jgi:endonuclease/exonuclease/phosphatase family metal-dependent hydrolase